jgi:hypothetical protein
VTGSNLLRRRRGQLLALAVGVVLASPAAALASGAGDWVNPMYLYYVGHADNGAYDNTYHAAINTAEVWNYYADGNEDCAGIWQTSIGGPVAELCAYGSGHNTAKCSDDGICMYSGVTQPGHAWIEDNSPNSDYFTGGWHGTDTHLPFESELGARPARRGRRGRGGHCTLAHRAWRTCPEHRSS